MGRAVGQWTNESVVAFAGDSDPVDAVLHRARSVVLEAMDEGWRGPPFDPMELAEHLGIEVRATEGVRDARILLTNAGTYRVEFNPFRSPARIRYSVAHEIVHTFFEDCGDRIRHRAAHANLEGNEWQLESLCNVGAAEILMPAGVFGKRTEPEVTPDALLALRKEFSVSTETVAIRMSELNSCRVAAFAASRIESGRGKGRYRLEYLVPSPTWRLPPARGVYLPENTVLSECSAIGYTNLGFETWSHLGQQVRVAAVAVPPFPGRVTPRVVGVVSAASVDSDEGPALKFVVGDALNPHGTGARIIAHVVNNRTPRWGGGFAYAVRERFPEVQSSFMDLIEEKRDLLNLGSMVYTPASSDLTVANMVAQRGYKQTGRRLVSYSALRTCLEQLAREAQRTNASVHIPRIGAGQGGGDWAVIEDLIRVTLTAGGVDVTVYDLPGSAFTPVQPSFDFG